MPSSFLLPRPWRLALALATCWGLAACAPLPTKDTSGAALEHPGKEAAATAPDPDKPTVKLPGQDLTGGVLYQLVLAEIALRRGQPGVALAAYADLAQSTRDPRIVRRAVELAAMGRQAQLELDLARLWVQLEPESVRARQMLVAGLASVGRIDEAEPHIAFLLRKDPGHVGMMLMRLARSVAQDPRRKDLAAMLDRLSIGHTNLPEAHFVRAYAALSEGKHDRAMEEAEKARALRPDWEPAALLQAQLLQEKGGMAAAMKFLGEFLQKYPKARDARMQYARALASEKKLPEAREQFRILDEGTPGNAEIVHALAVLSVQVGDLDEAEKRFKALLESGDGNPNALRLALGQLAETRKKPEEALKWYEDVTPGPQYLEARIKAAFAISRQKDVEAGLAYLKVLRGEGAEERVQILLAQSQMLRGANREKDAFQVLNKGLEAHPDQPDLLYESALMAEKIGRLDLLEPRLRKLIKLKPDFAHAYNALGYSLADRGERLDEAETLIKKALELAPDDPFILDSLGWVLYRKGELEPARLALEKALAKRPDPEIIAHLGEVLWQSGKREEATRLWRDAAKTAPDNQPLADVMKKFLGLGKP